MLNNLFLTILNMNLTASIVILFVLVARILLRKAPRVFSYGLWSVVLFRLVFPFSFESVLSLLPSNISSFPNEILYTQTSKTNIGVTEVDNVVSEALPATMIETSVNPLQSWLLIGEIIWLIGIAVLLTYSVVSLLQLKK